MTINSRWYNDDQTVILMEFPQRWTWAEFYAEKDVVDTMMDKVDHPCALILELPPNVIMPENILSNARTMFSKRHPRSKAFMLVSSNKFAVAMLNLFSSLVGESRRTLWVVKSIDEAQRQLQELGYLRIEKTA